MADISSFVARLQKVRKHGKDYMACCPAHKDRSPSLTIAEKDGRILVHCFAGCSVEEVVAAVGMELKDLMPENVGFHRKKSDPRPFNPYDVLAAVRSDMTLALLTAKDMQRGIVPDEAASLNLAKLIGRITIAIELAGGKL